MKSRPRWKSPLQAFVLCAVLCIGVRYGLTGCSSDPAIREQQRATTQAEIDRSKEILAVEKAKETAVVTSPSATPEQVAASQKQLERIAEIDKRLQQAEKVFHAAFDEHGNLNPNGAIAAAGSTLPPPWNLLVMFGGPLIVAGIQELRVRRERAASISIVKSVDVASVQNPGIGQGFKSLEGTTKDVIREQLTPLAKKLVDEHSAT